MLFSQTPNSKEDQNVKIRFNSNFNKQNSFKDNNNKSYGFDYQAMLLNKKRKLENDLKNGNINNFNKTLNNAVMNGNRNNDNELIPNKIEFKLSHILKGEKKISENSPTLADFNNGDISLNGLDKNNIKELNAEKIANVIACNKNEYNKIINNNNLKNSDSDNNSDLTKTSSVEDPKNVFEIKDQILSKPAILNNNNSENNKNNLNSNSEFDLLRNTSVKSNNNDLIKLNSKSSINITNIDISLTNKPASRKNSCLSNSSDKQSKTHSHKNQVFHDHYVDNLLEWKRPSHVGSGLNNMGNTCFLNSVLQSLLYTPGLINYFSFSEHKRKCNPRGLCLMCEFHCLVDLSKSNKLGALTPKNILNNLKFISKNIKIGRQEDAHEFLLYLLDGLEKACKNYVTSIKNNFIVSSNLNDDNLIQKLFGGKMASCVICLKCKNVSKKIDQYLDISIDIYNSDSIHRSLKNYCKPESLSGSNKFYCESCKTKNDSLKKFTFENFPRVLILHLKRFDNFQRKIKKFVEYPADLDLTNFSENKSEKYKYRLYAVLVHEGSTISWGHYYCYIKNSNDLWYCMNDSHVSQTSLKNVLSQSPYLLFYERILEKKPEKININSNDLIRKNSIDQKLNLNRASSVNSINNSNIINKSISNGNININNVSKNESLLLQKQISKDFSNVNNSNNIILKDDKNSNNDIEMKKENTIILETTINLIKKKTEEIKETSIKENQKVNKFDDISKQLNDGKVNENNKKANISLENNTQINKNILNITQKSSDLIKMEEKNKKMTSELKYKENDNKEDETIKPKNKEEIKVCMGINEIRKELFSNRELKEKDLNSKKEKKEEDFDLLRSKSSFEMKINLCDKIDENENLDLKKCLSEVYKPQLNLRSRNTPLMSRKFKRLISIFEKFGNTNNKSFVLNKSKSQEFIDIEKIETEIDKEFDSSNKIEDLELNETPIKVNKNQDLNLKTKENKKEYNVKEENVEIENKETENNENQENEGPIKKRIFNTKINEIYHGRFIERWEDEEDDENELNKLRNQADFVRKSDAFKKQKLLRKSKYDMDYDAGKQKKVRIYDEKDSKVKNVFQQKHTNIIKKIKKGIDPNKILNNENNNFDRKRHDKKFKHRDRNGKYENDRNGRFNRNGRFDNRNGKFNNRNERFNNRNGKFGNNRMGKYNNDRKDRKFNKGFRKNNFSPDF